MNTASAIKEALVRSAKFENVSPVEGGMNGYAFRARNVNVGRVVFLKVVDLVPEARNLILSEIQCIAKATTNAVAKRNIVEVYDGDCLTIDGQDFVCFQMEYIEGPSLGYAIEERSMGQQDAVRLANEILNGLGHLHHERILHRDLKPHNIMLANSIPKISDFGSATCLQDGEMTVPASRHSALYVPPEGWSNPSVFTFQSDIYQVGVVLYEMVNGALEYQPFHYITTSVRRSISAQGASWGSLDDYRKSRCTDESLKERAEKQSLLPHGRAPRPYLSPRLKQVIWKATNPRVEQRFPSATAFASALQRLSLPNWCENSIGEYSTSDWNGYDWKLCTIQKQRSAKVELSKRKTGTSSYRCVKAHRFESIESACTYVERGEVG